MTFFLIFRRRYDLTLHANCLLRRQYAHSVRSSKKNKKNITNSYLLSAESAHSMVSVKNEGFSQEGEASVVGRPAGSFQMFFVFPL